MGYFSHSILVTEFNFALKICKFWFFWNSCEIPEFIVEFEKTDLGYDMGCQFHLVSSTELNFAVTNDNFTKMKELKKNYFDRQLRIKIYFKFLQLRINDVLGCRFELGA